MGFEEFLPESEENDGEGEIDLIGNTEQITEKVTQNQVYDVITSKKPDWQVIIYDLISSEQLDPWDVDIIILTSKYFEKILELEDDPDFYISSKVLLASSILLRIKSEFLLNKHIKSIDEILFGKTEIIKKPLEKIEIDEDELPILIPKTPLPRLRKVTLNELITALDKAINTESRRIKREVAVKRAKKMSYVDIPKFRRVDLKDRIKEFYARVLTMLNKIAMQDKKFNKVSFSKLTGKEKNQKLACFLPLLHLSNTKKLWLDQDGHFEEIWIYLYKYFNENRDNFLEELEEDIEDAKEELEHEKSENMYEKKSGLEKAREKREEKKKLQVDMKKELEKELGSEITNIATEIMDIEEQENIEKKTGFSDE